MIANGALYERRRTVRPLSDRGRKVPDEGSTRHCRTAHLDGVLFRFQDSRGDGFLKKCAKSAISAKRPLLMCRLADHRRSAPRFRQVEHWLTDIKQGGRFRLSPGQSGDKRDYVTVYPLQIGERPVCHPPSCHPASLSPDFRSGDRWCVDFQVVKTAQSRGRTERTLLARWFLLSAGPRGAREYCEKA